jgi:hypothetical protein
MKTSLTALGLLLGLSAAGCTESNTGEFTYVQYDLAPSDMPATDAGGDPAPPGIGAQLDRVGRPLISTLLVNPFEQALTGAGADTKPRMQDGYNGSVNPANWQANYAGRPWLADGLAFWDGVDGACGNQLTPPGGMLYTTLANVLANDFLYIDTTKTACNRYLAVELGDTTNCGGRQPDITGTSNLGTVGVNNNVIDTTLNLFIGVPAAAANVYANGVTRDADGVPVGINTTLPFLLGPS